MPIPKRRPLKPGEIFGLVLIAEALIIDEWLIKNGHDTISTCTRTVMVGKILAVYFGLHLVAQIPGDPLTLLGQWRLSRMIRNSQLVG